MTQLIQIPGIREPVTLTQPLYTGSHFTWAEATHNGERIPQSTNFGGIIIPATQITSNIIKIGRELDKIREDFGNRPIHINSWYRSPRVNKDVGGVSNSQHLLGWAVDITIEGYTPHQVAARLRSIWKGGLGDSATFTHLDLRYLLGLAQAYWNYGNA